MQVNNIFMVNFIFCPLKTNTWKLKNIASNRGILADVIVYIFAHLHTALLAEGNMLDIN